MHDNVIEWVNIWLGEIYKGECRGTDAPPSIFSAYIFPEFKNVMQSECFIKSYSVYNF